MFSLFKMINCNKTYIKFLLYIMLKEKLQNLTKYIITTINKYEYKSCLFRT